MISTSYQPMTPRSIPSLTFNTHNCDERKPIGTVDRVCKRIVYKLLEHAAGGTIKICDGRHTDVFGTKSELSATVKVTDPRFYRQVVFGGHLGAADSLIAGSWSCDDLVSLVRILIRSQAAGNDLNRTKFASVRRQFSRFLHFLKSNSPTRARRNIQQHYDLGNDFYELWLDPTMAYSSGIFENPNATMEEASIAKMDRLCCQLQLSPRDHLLEIGTGWGALAIHAARKYGCRVTTTTISDEQYKKAKERVAAANLSDRITLLKKDYRKLTGKFDKIVSVEMIEAVGHAYYNTFFETCGRLLKDNGAMLLQGIVISDEHYDTHIKSADFISQYIFPGGSLPSISVLTKTAASTSNMRVLEVVDFAPHYAETLRRWRSEFYRRLQEVRSLGFDDRFIRMWEYYFCYCEAAFEERRVNVVHMHFAKRGCKLDKLGFPQQPILPPNPLAHLRSGRCSEMQSV